MADEKDGEIPTVGYAGPAIGLPARRPRSFRLDLDPQRNLWPLVLLGLFLISVVISAAVLHFGFQQ